MRAGAASQRGISESSEPAPPAQPGHVAVCLVRQPVFNAYEELLGHRLLSREEGSGGYLAARAQTADAELELAEELHALAPRGLVFLSVSRKELLERRALSLPYERVVLACGRTSSSTRTCGTRSTVMRCVVSGSPWTPASSQG